MSNGGGDDHGRNPEVIRRDLARLIEGFEKELGPRDLRTQVLALIPIFHALRALGKALVRAEATSSARDRILFYFKSNAGTVIDGDELLVVSGIQEYARRIRELRVQGGWAIASGVTMKESREAEFSEEFKGMRPSEYVLLGVDRDREAADRWNLANAIRKGHGSVRDKLLLFLRENVGRSVTGEELRYVAGDKGEWASRARELRTELGWPLVTRANGRPDLTTGMYLLEADRQSREHERQIPDGLRREVLKRDDYSCANCQWRRAEWNSATPRHLELHEIREGRGGAEKTADDLRTLCTACHDHIHAASAE